MRPNNTAIKIAMINAGTPTIPQFCKMPFGPVSMSIIKTAPMATSVEPTARSMPPEMMTRVIPNEIIPMPALLRRMLIQFESQTLNHSENEPNSNPSANVCRTIMTNRAIPVLNNTLVIHVFRRAVIAF
jgi:hypothetical protein